MCIRDRQYPARPHGHRRLFEELLQRHLVLAVLFFLPASHNACDVCFLSLSLFLSLSHVKNESVLHKTQVVVVLFLMQRRTFIVAFFNNVFFL